MNRHFFNNLTVHSSTLEDYYTHTCIYIYIYIYMCVCDIFSVKFYPRRTQDENYEAINCIYYPFYYRGNYNYIH
jgi:hypothetical protein